MKVFGDDSVFTGQWIFSSGVEVELQSKSGWRWQPQHTNQVVIFSRLWKVRNHPRIGMSQSSSSPGLIKSCSESPVAHNQAIMAFTKVSCWTLEWVMFLYCLFFFLPENSTLLLLPIFPSYVADIMMVNGERWDLWPRASWKKAQLRPCRCSSSFTSVTYGSTLWCLVLPPGFPPSLHLQPIFLSTEKMWLETDAGGRIFSWGGKKYIQHVTVISMTVFQ